MRLLHFSTVILSLLCHATSAAEDKKHHKSKPDEPCTVHSSNTGAFFDLNPISLSPPPEGKKPHKDQRTESWHAKGHDYPANFTLNVCAPVLEHLKNVVGVSKDHWKNISAFYEQDGKTYSIG